MPFSAKLFFESLNSHRHAENGRVKHISEFQIVACRPTRLKTCLDDRVFDRKLLEFLEICLCHDFDPLSSAQMTRLKDVILTLPSRVSNP